MTQSEEILRCIPVACIRLDNEGLITYVNPYASSMLGLPRPSIKNCHFREVLSSLDTTPCLRAIHTALHSNTGTILHFSSPFNGRNIRLNIQAADRGLLLFFTDIHKDTNDIEDQTADNTHRVLLENLDQGFCIIRKIDTAPGQASDFRYISANAAFEKHTRISNAVGKRLREVVPQIDNVVVDYYDKVVQTKEAQHFVKYIKDLDIWIEASVYALPQPNDIAILFSDVSAKIKTEQALEESRSRLSVIFEVLPLAIGFTDAAGKLKFSNSAMAYYLPTGIIPSLDKERQHRWRSWDPEGRLYKPENYPGARALKGERVVPGIDFLYKDDAGNSRWTRVTSVPVHDREGNISGHVSFVQDIDQAKRDSEALRKSEEQFRSLVTASSSVVYKMSADWRKMHYLMGNSVFPDTVEATTNWVDKYIPATDRRSVWSGITKAIADKSTFDLEHRVLRADGSIGWIHSRAVPVLNAQGQIEEWLGTGKDITIRKQAEEALRESEQRFKASTAKYLSLFNSINQGFCILELIFNAAGKTTNYRILEMNPAFERQTGMKRKRGAAMYRIRTEQEQRCYAVLGEVARSGKSCRFEEGSLVPEHWFDVFAFSIDAPEQHHVAVLFNDITERKKAEKRQEFLLEFSDALRPLGNPADVQSVAARLLGEHLQVNQVHYSETVGDLSVVNHGWGSGIPAIKGSFSHLDIGKRLLDGYRSGRTQICTNITIDTAASEQERRLITQAGFQAYIAVPLIKDGHWFATLAAHSISPRDWTPGEVTLLEEVAERTWAAVERAHAESALRENEARYRLRLQQDVAERTNELRQTKELLRGTLDSSPNMIQVFEAVRNKDGKIVDFVWTLNNETSERIYGRVEGESLLERNPGVVETGIFDHFVEVTESGIPQQYEKHYTLEQFDGWFFQSVVKLNDGVATTTADITQRKLAEEELFRNYLLLKQSEEVAGSGTWDFNMQTGALSWSDGMYKMFNLDRGVSVNPQIYSRYATKENAGIARRIAEHLREGKEGFEETLEICISGEVKVLRLKGSVINNEHGHPARMLGVDLDITAIRIAERRLREMEVRQRQQLFQVTLNTQEDERRRISESLHNGLGQLLYGTKLSMAYLNVKTATENRVQFERAKTYTEQLLTDAIKETRRISHELMPTVLAEFGLQAAIKDICLQLQDGVRFKCATNLGEHKLDNYLELAIFRMVQELMVNVIKHAKATQAEVEVRTEDQEVVILVRDNGKGISITKQDKPGIGLASIRNNVDSLNGHMIIESGEEKGTTVEVRLPLQ